MTDRLLEVRDLQTSFRMRDGIVRVLAQPRDRQAVAATVEGFG